MNTALVIGATGLVGSELVRQLLDDSRFGQVRVFVRKSTGISHQKLSEQLIDLENPDSWKYMLTGDVLFSALGTTLKKAGSKAAQWKVDYDGQYNFAKAAAANHVPALVMVSSAGASANSPIFYSRMKGELDRDVKKLPIERITLIKPGILAGDRKESRPAEKVSIRMMEAFGKIPGLKKYRPIHASLVARAMIRAALDTAPGIREYEMEEVFRLASQTP